ncbi:hypothetical protein Vafri_13233, partial [Volvox africanus]
PSANCVLAVDEDMTSVLALLAYRYLAWASPTRCPYPSQNGVLPKQTACITFPIFVYSHRGGNLERNATEQLFLENTLPAFRNSAAIGVDVLELDVQLTRDGLAAVFHDRELGRLCGPAFRGKRISDYNYADLPRLNPLGSVPTIIDVQDPDFTRIPLLEEVFKAHPDKPVQIDLKAPSQQLVHVVSELVSRYHREKLVLWGSFLHNNNNGLYAANPNVPLFMSGPRAQLLLAAYCAGRFDDIHIYESAIIMPWRIPLSSWLHRRLLLPGFFRLLNGRGVSVILFGNINNEAAFRDCTTAGANALCTDHPSRLLRWLAAREGHVHAGRASHPGIPEHPTEERQGRGDGCASRGRCGSDEGNNGGGEDRG